MRTPTPARSGPGRAIIGIISLVRFEYGQVVWCFFFFFFFFFFCHFTLCAHLYVQMVPNLLWKFTLISPGPSLVKLSSPDTYPAGPEQARHLAPVQIHLKQVSSCRRTSHPYLPMCDLLSQPRNTPMPCG